ncbi:hypothetical protein HWI79_1403 [Cryptosporidium felis]|nr:hypothetical protein HWI79_1403 [Cryptosporidium felis]
MSDYVMGIYDLVEQKVGSDVLVRVVTASFISLFVTLASYYFLKKREQEKAKKYNDKRIREIRENQMKTWEEKRSQNLKKSDCESGADEKGSHPESAKKEGRDKKKSKLNWSGSNSPRFQRDIRAKSAAGSHIR